MWIQKSPSEITAAKRSKLLQAACLDALVGVCLWYVLVRLAVFYGLLPASSISPWVAGAVVLLILPASWLGAWRMKRKRSRTLVCDRCNVVKSADHQLLCQACQCGGHYRTLAEMKWINPSPAQDWS